LFALVFVNFHDHPSLLVHVGVHIGAAVKRPASVENG
jgi:hypothetical protein